MTRITCDPSDPAYSAHFVGCARRGVRVSIDDKDVTGTRIVLADDEAGVIERYLWPLRVNAARDGAERETLRGRVQIYIPPGDPLRQPCSRP